MEGENIFNEGWVQAILGGLLTGAGIWGYNDTKDDIKDSKNDILSKLNSGFYETEIARPNEVSFDSLIPQLVQAGQIDPAKISRTKYNKVDPVDFLQGISEYNTDKYKENFEFGKEQSTDLSQFEVDELLNIAPQLGVLGRGETDLDNTYNQARRTQNVNQATPYFNPTVNEGLGRTANYAKGNFLTPEEDRAYEVFSRSISADGNFARGFGDDSTAGRNASDLASAERRFQISQYGDSAQKEWLNMGFQANFDTPIKAQTSQDISGVPSLSPIQTQQGVTNALTPLTSIDGGQALSTEINQNQFSADFTQSRKTNNAQFQQNANIQNVANDLQAALSNQQLDYDSQLQKLSQDWNYSLSIANAEQAGYNQEAATKSELLAAQQFYDGLLLQNKVSTYGAWSSMIGQLLVGLGHSGLKREGDEVNQVNNG